MKTLKLAVILASSGVMSASADLLVDRGLPTANLNNAAGANRANVAWADNEPTGTTPYAPGDSFSIGGSGNYIVSDIRVWEVGGSTTGLSLLGGFGSGSITSLSSSYTAQSVTYGDGSTYQGSSGGFLSIYQLDFAVNIPLNGSQTLDFFLNGPSTADTVNGGYDSLFLHASNAGLSGSPQQGSDGVFLFYDPTSGNVLTWGSGTGAGTYDPGVAGWDKDSDGNVQVFGSAVPEPRTLVSGALMLLPFGAGTLRMLRKRLAA
jgi:hypothetical protein